MGDAVVGTGFSFNSGLNPYKYNVGYAAVQCNNNGNLISYPEPMINLVTKQFKEDNIYDLIPELEINDDWSFELTGDFLEENKKIWTKLGLLEGLKEPDKTIVSYNYGMMAIYLMYNKELSNVTYGGLKLETVIFPIIQRGAYSEKIRNPKLFWDFCGEWLRERADWIDNLRRPGVNLNAEADACRMLGDTIESIIETSNEGKEDIQG